MISMNFKNASDVLGFVFTLLSLAVVLFILPRIDLTQDIPVSSIEPIPQIFNLDFCPDYPSCVTESKYSSPSCDEESGCLLLSELIYFEARGEGRLGMEAVAHVVMNRVDAKFFPNSIIEVIEDGCQFSYRCYTSFSVNDEEAFAESQEVALDVMYGRSKDPTGGADHYFNPKKVNKTPKFALVYEHTVTINDHMFYRRDH